MRHQGRVSNWNDDKGFGFVVPNGGGEKAFVHIKAFLGRSRRPVDDDVITYTLAKDAQGRLRADNIRFALEPHRKENHRRPGAFADIVLAVFVGGLLTMIVLGRLSPNFLLGYVAMSLVTLFVYRSDKIAAKKGRRRTPEITLHMLALACGWPGALLAQRWFRHKSKKTSFQVEFWATVVVNLVAMSWLATDAGNTMIRDVIGML